jgi:Protein of unknown function (DUF2442)
MVKRMTRDREVLAQIPAARRRGRVALPKVVHVRLDRHARRLHVTLSNEAMLVVPVRLIPSLRRVADSVLAGVTIGVAGVGLRWDDLDEDLTIEGLARVALGRGMLPRASDEDAEDLAAFGKRAKELTVAFEDLVSDLKRRRRL